MAYGLRIKKADGTVIVDTSDLLARVRYSSIVASGVSSSVVLSDISGKTVYPFSVPLTSGAAHDVSISGTTFTWTESSGTYYSSAKSLVGVIISD